MRLFVITLLGLSAIAAAATNTFKNRHYVPGHDVMVHLFEWKWLDIAVECERFLGPKKYGGIQVKQSELNNFI